MTQEEKDLLLKDLSARLFYGVLLQVKGKENESHKLEVIADDYSVCFTGDELFGNIYLDDIKPYLRSMSSMTEKEKEEFKKVMRSCTEKILAYPTNERWYQFFDAEEQDFMNAHHFDYRGLIPMGLALEAPDWMYKTE